MNLIRRKLVEQYVNAFVSVYRQPGDLNDSWKIGGPDVDARYGVDQPPEAPVEGPFKLVEVICETYDQNGWRVYETVVYGDSKLLASSRG